MEDCVRTLDLRIRAPAAALRAVEDSARTATVRMFERAAAMLEARAPGRVLLVSEFPIAIRIRESGLVDSAELEAVAAEIADALERSARSCVAPSPRDDLVVFENESRWREAFQAATNETERAAWYFDAIAESTDRPVARATPGVVDLLRQDFEGTLGATLIRIPTEELPAFEAGVAAAALVPPESSTPGRDPAANVLALGRIRTLIREEMERRDGSVGASPRDEPDSIGFDERGEPGDRSDLCGLFYLLRLTLELGLVDLLWKACLPEGRTIGHALGGLVGEEDVALTTIAGGPVGEIRISEDQREDIARALFSATLAALPRRGLARVPELHAELAETPAGRFLVVSAFASPFVLFACPVRDDADVPAALAALITGSGGTAISASPALAMIERSGRIRPRSTRVRPSLLEWEDPLLAQIAGSLAFLFAARAGVADIASPRELVERCFRLTGRIITRLEEIRVVLDSSDVDLAVRLAGLDADPGWIPWVGRRVILDFVER